MRILRKTLHNEKDVHGDYFRKWMTNRLMSADRLWQFRVCHINSYTIINYVSNMKLSSCMCISLFHWILSFSIIGNLCSLRLQECMALHIA